MAKAKGDTVSVREALRDTLDAFFKKCPDDKLQASLYAFLDDWADKARPSPSRSDAERLSRVRYLNPVQAAKRMNVSKETVVGWIKSGELRAIDLALVLGKRPCYRVSEQDIQAFEEKMQRTRSRSRNRGEKKRASKKA